MSLLLLPMTTSANNTYLEKGLSLIKVSAEARQEQPLNSISTITLPSSIETIGQAINYVLLESGYELESRELFSPETRTILMKKIPMSQRYFEYTTKEQIISALVGKSFDVRNDEINRTVSINLRNAEPKGDN